MKSIYFSFKKKKKLLLLTLYYFFLKKNYYFLYKRNDLFNIINSKRNKENKMLKFFKFGIGFRSTTYDSNSSNLYQNYNYI